MLDILKGKADNGGMAAQKLKTITLKTTAMADVADALEDAGYIELAQRLMADDRKCIEHTPRTCKVRITFEESCDILEALNKAHKETNHPRKRQAYIDFLVRM